MTSRYTKRQAALVSATPVKATVEVVICEPHCHNGQEQSPGDILALPPLIASVLVKAGTAKYL